MSRRAQFFFLTTIGAVLIGCSGKGDERQTATPEAIPRMVNGRDLTPEREVQHTETGFCGHNDYTLSLVRLTPEDRWNIELVNGTGTHLLETPSWDEYQNLGVHTMVRSSDFLVIVEYGTRINHELTFWFRCDSSDFQLVRVDHESFDKHLPDDPGKYESRRISPPQPFQQVRLSDFLTY